MAEPMEVAEPLEAGGDQDEPGTIIYDVPIEGTLDWSYEPGSDGVRWAFTTDYSTATRPYQNLHILHDGDTLTILAEDGSVRWSGVISFEYETGWRPFSRRSEPGFGQQEVGGFWVNGVQRGWALADWADLFFGHEVALPAVRETVRALPLKAVLVATP